MNYHCGDYVCNPKRPEWGPGKVLKIRGSAVTVYFRDSHDRPVRKIETRYVALQPAAIDSDTILDNLPPYDAEKGKLAKKRVTHADGVEMFKSYYPLMFKDPGYWGDRTTGERAYKIEACEAFQELLGNGVGRELLKNSDTEELHKRLFTVEGLLNLLSPYEKMALSEALHDESAALNYFAALFDVIEAEGANKECFEAMIVAVDNLPHEEGRARVATWPILTQYPFIARPETHMFLKPEVTKACAARMMFDLNYQSRLNWATYAQLLKLSQMLFGELKPMGAKDNIDVQSFIWVVGAY